MHGEIKVLAISGSLRKLSFNTALLRAAQELVPPRLTITLYDFLGAIPPYDEDVRQQSGFPPVVDELRSLIRAADALLFATPEYNRSFSGILKNAIDWVSRPPDQPFKGKPAMVTGAATGAMGTALANYHLRQVLSVLGVHILPGLEVLVTSAAAKFNAEGKLTDEPTRKFLGEHLIALRDLAQLIWQHDERRP